MNEIESLILIVLAAMGLPDVCRRLGMPALVYPAYLIAGMLIGPVLLPKASSLLAQVGSFGFILLLFQIGLEVDLPRRKDLAPPLGRALAWCLVQYPLVAALGLLAGLSLGEAVIGAATLTAVSMSVTYPAIRHYPGLSEQAYGNLILSMVMLEVLGVIALSAGDVLLKHGIGLPLLMRLGGIAAAVVVVAFSADHLGRVLGAAIERTTRWRVHFIVLLVLLIAGIGDRLGLSPAKTAFFLGLFMTRATHEGMALEEHLAPIAHRFLIPVFFLALGTYVPVGALVSPVALWAVLTTAILFAVREVMHRRWLPSGGDGRAFLLLCPNITIGAVGATVVSGTGGSPLARDWIVLVSSMMTVAAVILLPRTRSASVTGAVPEPSPGTAASR